MKFGALNPGAKYRLRYDPITKRFVSVFLMLPSLNFFGHSFLGSLMTDTGCSRDPSGKMMHCYVLTAGDRVGRN
jgi:hypothetical protein